MGFLIHGLVSEANKIASEIRPRYIEYIEDLIYAELIIRSLII